MSTVHDIKDASARRRLIEVFGAAGWHINPADVAGRIGGPTIYFVDVETGQLYVVATTQDAVPRLSKQFASSGYTFDEVCGAVGTLIGDLANGKTPLDDGARSALTVGSILYIVGTKGYAIAKAQRFTNPQFLVLRYPDVSAGDYVLRPTPLTSPDPLNPAEVEAIAAEILELDRHNHPERFPRAKVIQFRLKRRHDV